MSAEQSIEELLRGFISTQLGGPLEIPVDGALADAGYMASMQILALAGFINDTWQISPMAFATMGVTSEDLYSLKTLADLVRRAQGEAQ